jgi:hypothetical protein
VCQRSNVDDVTPEVLYDLGVVVRILQVQKSRRLPAFDSGRRACACAALRAHGLSHAAGGSVDAG